MTSAANAAEKTQREFRVGALPPSTFQALRSLQELRPVFNIAFFLFPALWIFSALLMATTASRPVTIAGTLVIAYCMHSMAILLHEAVHGSVFRSPRRDRWAAFCMAAPFLLAGTAYRVTHFAHHRHLGSKDDPDSIPHMCKTELQWRVLFYLKYLITHQSYLVMAPILAWQRCRPGERPLILREYALIVTAFIAIVAILSWSNHLMWIVWYWLIPEQIALLVANIRGLAEHDRAEGSDDVRGSRSIVWGKIRSFIVQNVNYHLEHHLVPSVPWYNLQALHSLLHQQLTEGGADFRNSYLGFAAENLVLGPGALAEHQRA